MNLLRPGLTRWETISPWKPPYCFRPSSAAIAVALLRPAGQLHRSLCGPEHSLDEIGHRQFAGFAGAGLQQRSLSRRADEHAVQELRSTPRRFLCAGFEDCSPRRLRDML